MRQLWLRVCEAVRGSRWPLVAAIGLILLVVVPWRSYQDHTHWARVQWVPFASPPVKVSDIVGNILLYVPLGVTAVRRRGAAGALLVTGVAFLLSMATEFTQVYSHGRFPSAGDVTCNVVGAWIGARLCARRGCLDTGSRAEGAALH